MEKPIIYVGFDVHKDTIAALAEARKREDVRQYGQIANPPTALRPRFLAHRREPYAALSTG